MLITRMAYASRCIASSDMGEGSKSREASWEKCRGLFKEVAESLYDVKIVDSLTKNERVAVGDVLMKLGFDRLNIDPKTATFDQAIDTLLLRIGNDDSGLVSLLSAAKTKCDEQYNQSSIIRAHANKEIENAKGICDLLLKGMDLHKQSPIAYGLKATGAVLFNVVLVFFVLAFLCLAAANGSSGDGSISGGGNGGSRLAFVDADFWVKNENIEIMKSVLTKIREDLSALEQQSRADDTLAANESDLSNFPWHGENAEGRRARLAAAADVRQLEQQSRGRPEMRNANKHRVNSLKEIVNGPPKSTVNGTVTLTTIARAKM